MKLPKLPEDYFWRVDSDWSGFMTVEIRRKRKWFGSRHEEHSMVMEDPPVSSAILAAADRALRKFNDREKNRQFLAEFRLYEGDYTP